MNSIIKLLEGKTLTANSLKFYSPDHKQYFEAKEIRLKIDKEPDHPEELRLNLNGNNILDWFKQKYQQAQQKYGVNPKAKQNKGISL